MSEKSCSCEVKKVLFGMKEGVFGMQEHVLDMSMLVVRRILVFADRTDGVFVLQEVVAGEKRFFLEGNRVSGRAKRGYFPSFFSVAGVNSYEPYLCE